MPLLMPDKYCFRYIFQKSLVFLTCLFCTHLVKAQSQEIDSLLSLLSAHPNEDSLRVTDLNELAYRYNTFNPAQGLLKAQEAYQLAKKVGFSAGESRALRNIANTYRVTGDYNKALEILLKQLEVDEKTNIPDKLASTLMNIGILHHQQKDYKKALPYYLQSDSIIRVNKIANLNYFSFQNLGELYEQMGKLDSAFFYYQKSLTRAYELKNNYYIGATISGLGNCYVKNNDKEKGLALYYEALAYLKLANEEDMYCQTAYNMARIFEEKKQKDSALHYAHVMLGLATKDNFQSRKLDASTFLANFYKKQNRPDSALLYFEQMVQIRDTINGLEKVKDFQQKTFNEEVRQAEQAERKRKEEEERRQQLQLLVIGVFIPVFLLFTLLISRRKIHVKAIQVLGIVSLLLVFEYLTLLLHPFVVELTHHTPFYELLIFVAIAAILIPGHHRIEHWFIARLTHRHHYNDNESINIKKTKIKLKKPSE